MGAAVLGCFFTLPYGLLVLFIGVSAVMALNLSGSLMEVAVNLLCVAVLSAIAIAFGWFARTTWLVIKHEVFHSEIPYVPPVTPSTLPSEEILVRGATEPSAPQETLLRAAQGTEEMKPEELLRSTQQ